MVITGKGTDLLCTGMISSASNDKAEIVLRIPVYEGRAEPSSAIVPHSCFLSVAQLW
jgi:hypothetical protein